MRKTTTTSNEWATAHALARETGSAERHIIKWMEREGVKTREAGGRTLYHRDQAVAACGLHQRPREDEQPVGLEAITAELTQSRRAAQVAGICVHTMLEAIERVEDEIKKNCPADEPVVVPEKCPSFSAEQAAWLIRAINKPVRDLKDLFPKE